MADAPAGLAPTNVSVVARLRPLGPQDEASCLSVAREAGGGSAAVVFAGGGGAGGGGGTNNGNGNSGAGAGATTLTFRFDHVHASDATQEDIFQHCEPLVDGVFKGLNGTIMAYGQTGSGKTHTLIGDVAGGIDGPGAGVVPRACRLLLQRAAAAEGGGGGGGGEKDKDEPAIAMTAVEIYAERVRCLLGGAQNLALKQDPQGGSVRAEGAAEVAVPAASAAAAALSAALARALANRAVAATDMNAASSRSHCVVTLRLLRTGAKLCLVDLAGSERAARSGAQGQALAEGAAINRSLSALAGVVSALASDEPQDGQHVPYRDSKLTRLLQDSLGGRARTVLVVCCSPGRRDAAETLSSLRFASRARGVKCLVAPVPGPAAGSAAAASAASAAAAAAAAAAATAELAEARAEAAALRARLASSSPSGGLLALLPWVLRCASAAVLGAYLAWEGGRVGGGAGGTF